MPLASTRNSRLPVFDVLIAGQSIPVEAEAHMVGITVDDSVELPSMFSLELGGSDDQKRTGAWVDDERLFAVGNAVEIKLGYGGHLESVISGEITALEPEFIVNHLPALIVRGYDRRHRLQRARRTRTFTQQKDSDIVSQIAREAGLTADVEDSKVTHDYVIQANQTDLDFLHDRARLIGFEVVVEDKKLTFGPVAKDKAQVLTLTMKDHLLEFYPRLTTCQQVSEISVRGWSAKDKKEIVGRAKAGDEGSTMGGAKSGPQLSESAFGAASRLISAQPVMSQAEADQIAKAHFADVALSFIHGEGVCLGLTALRAGKVIKIDGVGKRFSGQYYVESATHRYHPQDGYRTHFMVRRNAA